MVGQGHGNGDTLAARRRTAQTAGDACADPAPPGRATRRRGAAAVVSQAGYGHGQHDVFDGVEIRDQVARAPLPDKADLLAPVIVELVVGHAQQVVAVDAHAAGRGPIKPAENFISVVLPLPEAPMIAINSPFSIVMLRPARSATCSNPAILYILTSPSHKINGSAKWNSFRQSRQA